MRYPNHTRNPTINYDTSGIGKRKKLITKSIVAPKKNLTLCRVRSSELLPEKSFNERSHPVLMLNILYESFDAVRTVIRIELNALFTERISAMRLIVHTCQSVANIEQLKVVVSVNLNYFPFVVSSL